MLVVVAPKGFHDFPKVRPAQPRESHRVTGERVKLELEEVSQIR
jgi:hypothetical protein